jgi:guanine deaminase
MDADETYLERAIQLAVTSAQTGGGPFGAVLVRGGQILAEGSNAVVRSADPTAHAEIVAIRAACATLGSHELLGCVLYSSCEPCPMCLGAIHWARLSRLVFAADRDDAARAGFDDERLYREVSRPAADRFLPFEAWGRQEDRIPY